MKEKKKNLKIIILIVTIVIIAIIGAIIVIANNKMPTEEEIKSIMWGATTTNNSYVYQFQDNNKVVYISTNDNSFKKIADWKDGTYEIKKGNIYIQYKDGTSHTLSYKYKNNILMLIDNSVELIDLTSFFSK